MVGEKVLFHRTGGRRFVLSALELQRRTVGQDAGEAQQLQLPRCQRLGINLQRGDAPPIGRQGGEASLDERLVVQVLLLQVLGSHEHPFRPDHPLRRSHAYVLEKRSAVSLIHLPPARSTSRPATRSNLTSPGRLAAG